MKRRIIIVAVLGVSAACCITGLIALRLMNIDFNICLIKMLTDFDCPGCGATRMAVALLQLKIYQAFRYNPFVFTTAPMIGVLIIHQAKKYILDGMFSVWLDTVLIAYAIALVAFGIIRNISIFSWLKPTVI